MSPTSFAAEVAVELDRLVVSVHDREATHPDVPSIIERYVGHPGLVDVAGIVLIRRTLTFAELGLIVPYTPVHLLRAVIDNNVEAGLLEPDDGTPFRLTDSGREYARTVATLQDEIGDTLWSGHGDTVATTGALVLDHAKQLPRPMVPAAFDLFVPVGTRESSGAQILGVLRALRYRRADAHRLAWTEQDLIPAEAHALNHLWDQHRGAERVGQGAPQFVAEGIAPLQDKGFATDGSINDKGIALREQIEAATNEHNAPLYGALDPSAADDLLSALRSLPS